MQKPPVPRLRFHQCFCYIVVMVSIDFCLFCNCTWFYSGVIGHYFLKYKNDVSERILSTQVLQGSKNVCQEGQSFSKWEFVAAVKLIAKDTVLHN